MARLGTLLCLFCLPGWASAQDGLLQGARQAARSPAGESPSSHGSEKTGILGEFFSLLQGEDADEESASSLGDHESSGWPSHAFFLKYPYRSGFPGYRVPPAGEWPDSYEKWDRKATPWPWGGRLSVEDGNDFSGLNRAAGQMLLEHSSGFGMLTTWNHYHERLSHGCTDQMVMGDVNVTYTWAWIPWWELRVGAGCRLATDNRQTDLGFNVHLGSDFYPIRPWVMSWSADFGNVGSAGVSHFRGTLGVMVRGVEIFTGYDFLRIEDTRLQGPLVGVRLWF